MGPPSLVRRFVRQFRSALVYLLVFALLFDIGVWLWHGWHGAPLDAVAIAAVLLLNAGLGALQEHRSEAALARLEVLSAPEAWVLRDGGFVRIPSRDVVPGDVVRIEAGERVPADGVVVEPSGLMVDESVLTGESLPVDKNAGDRAHSGTLAVRGLARLRVTDTGSKSAMGKLAFLIGAMDKAPTPLEQRLGALGRRVAFWVAILAVVLCLFGIVVNGWAHLERTILFAVALAIAAVPEGMPAMVTLTLALGVQRMATRNAVVRRLSAVEALGSVTVIATDKTGTLTENRMEVQSLDSEDRVQALEAMVIAGDADVATRAGDPLDIALIEYAEQQGVDLTALLQRHARATSRSFDSAWSFMRATVKTDGETKSFIKGSPEVVLARSTLDAGGRARWLARSESAGHEGFRVVALAMAEGEREDGLRFLGLVSLWDAPRSGVERAIRNAREASVRVVMITGDHPSTAAAVARAVGLDADVVKTGADVAGMSDEELVSAARKCSVFARVSPEQKLQLIDALRNDGHVVAMTGDGVNDAPALKRADVGIAMGRRGSDVPREVADIVLTDDDLGSIVGAIDEGRNIYRNLQTFIRFTFSTNIALVIVICGGIVAFYALGLRDASGAVLLPLSALQLLWINFLGDGPPALALGLDRTPDVMLRAPRVAEGALLDRGSTRFVLSLGLAKGLIGVVLLLVFPLVGASVVAAQTGLFLYESIAKLISAYPSRRWTGHPKINVVLHASVGAGIALQIATVLAPGLRHVLGLERPGIAAMLILSVAIVATWALAELLGHTLGPGKAHRTGVPPSHREAHAT